MNLENFSVQEMNTQEVKNVDGGCGGYLLWLLSELLDPSNGDDFRAGVEAARK